MRRFLLLVAIAFAGIAHADPVPSPPAPSLQERPPQGTTAISSLPAAMLLPKGTLPRWPIELRSLVELRRICASDGCNSLDKAELALQRAATWMSEFKNGALRFDAAVVLSQIRQTIDAPALRSAFETARQIADRDDDHPQRRFWVAEMKSDAKYTSQWPVPSEPGKRTEINNVLHEALYCNASGWRPQTLEYVCGLMRDEGGYQTTHALWALTIAYQNQCVTEAAFTPCAISMQNELLKHQPAELVPKTTLDTDLYAERVLQALYSGSPEVTWNRSIEELIRTQDADGSWGIRRDGEDPYFRYHATMMSTWALSEWLRRLVAYPSSRP